MQNKDNHKNRGNRSSNHNHSSRSTSNTGKYGSRSSSSGRREEELHYRKSSSQHNQGGEESNNQSSYNNTRSTRRELVNDNVRINFVNLPHMNHYWSDVSELLMDKDIDCIDTLVETLRMIQSIVYGSTKKGSMGHGEFTIQSENRLTILLNDKSVMWEGREKFFTSTVEFIKDLVIKTPIILGPLANLEYYTHESQKQSTIQANGGMLPILGDLNKLPFEVQSKCVKLSKLECACILANSFFSTFPRMGDSRDGPHLFMPSINMDSLINSTHEASASKLLMIIHYFERLDERGFDEITKMGYVHFIRKKVDPAFVESLLTYSTHDQVSTFTEIEIHPEGVIEDCQQAVHADFANMYIGGGVLRGGAVQEEIRFVLSPETIVSRLFVEKMNDNESLLIVGTEQFSTHKGYAKTLVYGGDYIDKDYVTLSEHLRAFNSQIIAFDSKFYKQTNLLDQWQIEHIDREIVKAYSAFCSIESKLYDLKIHDNISTGHWGCGAFLSSKDLKFIIQFIAASIAEKKLHYYTFGEKEISEKMQDFVDFVKEYNFTVPDIYETLLSINDQYVKPSSEKGEAFYPNTFEYVKGQLKSNQEQQKQQ